MLLKSPVNRIGGKSFLASWLSEKIPRHALYCEPFSGAAHLLFCKRLSPVEVINDIESYLVNFFKAIRDTETRQRLIDILDYMPYSRSLWREIRTNWKQGNIPGDPVESSAQWFYLNRTCFSGDQRSGGFAVPSITGRNPVKSFRNAIDGLDTIAERIRNVCIENLPYQECIKRYDSKDTLFYCDPPYLDTEHYYDNTFGQEDHYKLAEILHGIKGKAMVSHYQNGLYDEMYKGWNRYEYQSFKGSCKSNGEVKPKTVEILYCTFEPSRQRSLFGGLL